jgi:hypothetical protein
LTPLRDADICQRNMRAFYIAGMLSVALPFAAIETADGAGIVSHNGGHATRTASADLLAGPGRGSRKNRGFRLAVSNVVALARHSDAGTRALGGTLSLAGGLIKGGAGAVDASVLSVTPTFGGTLSLAGGGISFLDGTTAAFGNGSGGTLLLSNGVISGVSGGEFHIVYSGGGTPTFDGRSTTWSVSGGGINVSDGTVEIDPGTTTNSDFSSGVVIYSGATVNLSGGTINVNGWMSGEPTGASEGGLLKVGSGRLTLGVRPVIASNGFTGTLNVMGGTFDFKASQMLDALTIGPGATVSITNVIGQETAIQSADPVPEPSAATLFALSAAALLARRVRHRK